MGAALLNSSLLLWIWPKRDSSRILRRPLKVIELIEALNSSVIGQRYSNGGPALLNSALLGRIAPTAKFQEFYGDP